MGVLDWNSKYSVGVNEIDEQHMKLISLLNQLYMKVEQNAFSEVEGVFKELEDYTHTHFSNEEKYMKEFKYKDMDAHLEQHKFFIEKLSEIKRESGDNNSKIIEITQFLLEWLVNHIDKVDTKLAPFLKENGVK